jgi:hypothetical protein
MEERDLKLNFILWFWDRLIGFRFYYVQPTHLHHGTRSCMEIGKALQNDFLVYTSNFL